MAYWSMRLAFGLAGCMFACGTLRAQTTDVQPFVQPWPFHVESWDHWVGSKEFAKDSKLYVVTNAAPELRQMCRVRSFDRDKIECARHFGHDAVIYQRSEVEALIVPRIHQPWRVVCGLFAGTGVAMIVTGAVLSFAAAPAVIVVGSLLLLTAPAFAIGASDYPDGLLYLQSGRQLTVTLRE